MCIVATFMFVYFLAIGYRFFIKPELSWVDLSIYINQYIPLETTQVHP